MLTLFLKWPKKVNHVLWLARAGELNAGDLKARAGVGSGVMVPLEKLNLTHTCEKPVSHLRIKFLKTKGLHILPRIQQASCCPHVARRCPRVHVQYGRET